MTTAQADYGTLAPLVKVVGWLISATAAISFSWRRRSNWEPAEQDISRAPAQVGGVLTAALIAVLWTQLSDKRYEHMTLLLIAWFGGVTLLSLLGYGLLVSIFTYESKYSPAPNQVAERRVIGGFRLTTRARAAKEERGLTVQEIFARASYNKDKVWTSVSLALSKSLFVFSYITLTVCGTALLTCAAILLLLANPH